MHAVHAPRLLINIFPLLCLPWSSPPCFKALGNMALKHTQQEQDTQETILIEIKQLGALC